jgi:predicted Rossmann fold nucleotide-binding protein DprA/Smf involved in DNA uptake
MIRAGFAVIPVELARSAAVSAQAKAVFIALTSHHGEGPVPIANLAREVGTTPATAMKALSTLHQRGWGSVLATLAPPVLPEEP